MSDIVLKKLPGVTSLTRRINVTDALFYSEMPDGSEKPILVRRLGLRGTQNVNGDKKEGREVSNVQLTDTAKSDADAVGVIIKTGIRFIALRDGLHSCALAKSDDRDLLVNFKESLSGFLDRAISEKSALLEIGCRYARNMANGRWLWRNRQFAQKVTVDVKVDGLLFTFDSLDIPLNEFDDYNASEMHIGKMIAYSLAGKNDLSFELIAKLDFGTSMNGSIEVYPSQNYLTDKPKGFARSLYAVGESQLRSRPDMIEFEAMRIVGHAAIRDTKAANALRTIDTWYPDYDSYKMPIAVEPCGANLGTQVMHRIGKKDSSFAYFKKLNIIEPASDEGLFVIASMIRGGVYSEGGEK